MFKNARNLNEFVTGLNDWRKMWNHRPLNINDAGDRQKIANALDAELSPENLTCDGELPHSVVQARYWSLIKICKELIRLDPNVKFYEAFEA
jgi:hypothetical protein